MTAEPKLKLMVASTVYYFQDQLKQICGVLSGFDYEVWNSHIGTIPVHPGLSNLENCVIAARNCDVFLGIVRPFYGSGVIGDDRSITHEECLEAVRLNKPRWFLVQWQVTFARQLLKPYMFRNGTRTKFKLKKNPVLDDLRVIELYHDVIQYDVPAAERRGHWAQDFYELPDVLRYLDSQFKDAERVRRICEEMRAI